MSTAGACRWPLHPPPGPLEALSSWLERIAFCYGLAGRDLVRHNLGPGAVALSDAVQDLDWDPPTALLDAVAERTATDRDRLARMTIAGWVPWLVESLHPAEDEGCDEQTLFDTYIRQDSVLLLPGETGRNVVGRWSTWRGPWLPPRPLRRDCPVCATNPEHGTALVWQLPLVHSCAEHGCRLEDVVELTIAAHLGKPMTPVPVSAQLAALDRRTYEGLTTGGVSLPRRRVHVGVWFRLLRSLLDELTIALSRLGRHSAATLRHIWQATDRPVRAGLNVWRPYEQLDPPRQETICEAAAVALHLAETGTITARGTLSSLLTPETHRSVGNGDPPIRAARERGRPRRRDDHGHHAATALDDAIAEACTDSDSAQALLNLATYASRTVNEFNDVRKCMLELGVPAEFLPHHHELGRTDLT